LGIRGSFFLILGAHSADKALADPATPCHAVIDELANIFLLFANNDKSVSIHLCQDAVLGSSVEAGDH